MLLEETHHHHRSFAKRNDSYSHCPLKKRPVTVVLHEDTMPKAEIKEEVIDVVASSPSADEGIEPENLSTKPEDLSRNADRSYNNNSQTNHNISSHTHLSVSSPVPPCKLRRLSSPNRTLSSATTPRDSLLLSPSSSSSNSPRYQPLFPSKASTPPTGLPPIHPVARKARIEVLQHDRNTTSSSSAVNSPTAPATPLALHHHHHQHSNFFAAAANHPTTTPASGSPGYHHAAAYAASQLYTTHRYHLPPAYTSAFRYQHQATAGEFCPIYPVPAYPHHASPEHHRAISPQPAAFVSQQPLASANNGSRAYAHWSSPEHGMHSPNGSISSLTMPSSPPISPEDLSSPGSDSGRSSAGSISTGQIEPVQIEAKSTSSSSRYQCSNCAKSYSTYSGLSKHQQFHCALAEGQVKKTFSCKYCDKLYLTLGALKMHIRTHTLPCKCHMCGKAFSRPWLLQGHIRTHTGEKPFSCQHCNRAFADRSNLRAHLQTHSEVKKYSCDSCSKTFSRQSLLTKHKEGGCPGIQNSWDVLSKGH